MTKAVDMSKSEGCLTKCPKESLGDGSARFVDGCGRAISHISPRMMQNDADSTCVHVKLNRQDSDSDAGLDEERMKG